MKVFITGICGQLGYDLAKELHSKGLEVAGSDIISDADCPFEYYQMDITDLDCVTEILSLANPDALIHCAAWTAVDLAEEENNKEAVYKVNVTGSENLARICKKQDIKMMYLSSDYVFDGQGTTPYMPEDSATKPLNFYGTTKLLGENAVRNTLSKYFIVRTSWIFGQNGSNFVKTMLKVGTKYPKVKVVNDQVGTPTYARDLAVLLTAMIQTEKYGYYHATNEGGFISWYEFTVEIYKQAGLNTTVIPVTTKEYGLSKATRPHNSRLDKTKLVENGFKLLPHWKEALSDYLKEIL